MSIGSLLGKLNPTTIKSKMLLAAGVALLVFIVWFGSKWDSWKIERLEKENMKLDVENQSSKQAAEDAKSVRVIDETAVTGTLDRQKAAEANSNVIQEQVRNDVRRLQQKLVVEQRALDQARADLALLELRRSDLGRPQQIPPAAVAIEGIEAPSTRVVVKTIEVSVAAVDARVAQRIVDGMWVNYCGQVPNDRGCPTLSVDPGSNAESPAK